MADFSVDFASIKNSAEDFTEMSKRLQRVAQESISIFIKLRTSFVSSHINSIKSTEINYSINSCADALKNMSKAAETAADTYKKYENKILSGDVLGENKEAVDREKYKDHNFVKFSQYMSTSEALKNVNFKFLSRLGYAVSHIGLLEFFKHTFGAEGYDETLIENAIKATIERNQNINTEVDSVELEAVSNISHYEDFINFLLISRGVSEESIEKIMEELGENGIKNLGKIASVGKQGIQTVLYLLQDYNSAIDQLEEMKICMEEAGATEYVKCVNNVINEYNNKLETIKNSVFDEAADQIIEKIGDLASGGAYSAVTFTVQGVSDISGLTDYSESVMNLEMNDGYVNAVTQTYTHYANKLKLGDYTQLDVEKCQKAFEVAKAAQLNQLEDMAAVCKGTELEKVREQIDLLERTNWDGTVNP